MYFTASRPSTTITPSSAVSSPRRQATNRRWSSTSSTPAHFGVGVNDAGLHPDGPAGQGEGLLGGHRGVVVHRARPRRRNRGAGGECGQREGEHGRASQNDTSVPSSPGHARPWLQSSLSSGGLG